MEIKKKLGFVSKAKGEEIYIHLCLRHFMSPLGHREPKDGDTGDGNKDTPPKFLDSVVGHRRGERNGSRDFDLKRTS